MVAAHLELENGDGRSSIRIFFEILAKYFVFRYLCSFEVYLPVIIFFSEFAEESALLLNRAGNRKK
jgi:hypothetical protein